MRSALQEGIVPGGGLLLNSLSQEITGETTADKILKDTLQAPLQQILINAGLDVDKIYEKEIVEEGKKHYKTSSFGYNVVSGEYGDMFKMGVVDPAKVTIQALSNAISVATTILTTNAIITHARVGQDD